MQFNVIQYNTTNYDKIQYNTILCNYKSPITRNIGQIVILAAIDKSVNPNSLKAQCMCPKSILINSLKSLINLPI